MGTSILWAQSGTAPKAQLAALQQALGAGAVKKAPSWKAALELLEKNKPSMLLVDVELLPKADQRERKQLVEGLAPAGLIVLVERAEEQGIKEWMAAGSRGCLLKSCEPEQLVSAVYAVAAGETYLDQKIAPVIADLVNRP